MNYFLWGGGAEKARVSLLVGGKKMQQGWGVGQAREGKVTCSSTNFVF